MLTKLLCEFGATALMIVFGVGVHCDTVLKGTKYQGSGHMFAITTWSFGISVCLFVFGGAVCMNPAWCLPVHRRLGAVGQLHPLHDCRYARRLCGCRNRLVYVCR